MTPDTDKELSGAELDCAVARHVMGWPEQEYGTLIWKGVRWSPSESIDAAMLVVEKMYERGYWIKVSDYHDANEIWEVEFGYEDHCWHKYSDSLPEAICRAALAAVQQ